ncbi:MAG TPA: DUF4112 domain-containing protein [Phenylobacterium sp.]|uniref:DUF4112 domain-containing protein n=1 Tax=Phenylobacterium conjunctum TaxID=1298959 RepID=A0ABW3T2W6_9CAUL|nr:DUF4112 domain-containing protein [Phenylobacterium sp.]
MTQERAHRAWRSAERIKRLSDRLVGVGPFGIGLDAVLDWIPGLGPIYSVGAGALLVGQALSARASAATILRMIAYLAADTATSSVPLAGWAIDALFPGHLMAANALQKDIEARHGPSDLPGWGGRKPSKGRKGRR